MLQFIHQSATLIFFWKPRSDSFNPLLLRLLKNGTENLSWYGPTSPSGLLCSLPWRAGYPFSSLCAFHRVSIWNVPPTPPENSSCPFTAPLVRLFFMKPSQPSPDTQSLSAMLCSLCPYHVAHTFITLNRHSGEMEQESWVRRSNLKISFITCCVSQSKWHNFSEPQLFNLWDGTNNSYNNTLPHRTLVVIKQVIINVNTVRSIRILDVIITKLYLLIDFELIECKTNIWPSTGHSAWAYSLPRLVYDRSYHFW